jgi:hypothetical protein
MFNISSSVGRPCLPCMRLVISNAAEEAYLQFVQFLKSSLAAASLLVLIANNRQ